MSVAAIGDVAGVERLTAEWAALAQGKPPTADPAWGRAAATALGYELSVVTVGGSGGLRGVVQLGRPAASRAGRLEFLGSAELHEPTEPAYAHDDDDAALADAVVATRRPLLLRRAFARSPFCAALRRAVRGRGATVLRDATACPYIDLDESWVEPESQLSARRRSDLRRARRRAESVGPVSFELRRPGPDEAAALLEEAFAIEASGWKGRTGTAMARDEVRGRFFRDYAAARAARGGLRLDFLSVGDRRVAMQLGVEDDDALWLLKIGYDEEHARSSPGMLLLRESIADAARRGLTRFEFLGSVEPWTRVWTTLERPCVSLAVYPAAPRGLAAGLADAASLGWRRLRERRARA